VSPCGLYWYDDAAALKPERFFRDYLVHVKGEWAGKPFEVLPWQSLLCLRPLFGWKRAADDLRRFRYLFLIVGKKNGKSCVASGLALYLLAADGEPGAEVYSAAADEKQARIVFGDAVAMVEESPALVTDAGLVVHKTAVTRTSTRSTYKVLSRSVGTKHGFNIHGLIFDEFHTQQTRDLYDTLYKGTSARRQPVTCIITTAGTNRESICFEEYERAKDVLAGTRDDPTFLPVVFEIGESDVWTDEDVWIKANPSLGITKRLDYMRDECLAASQEPRKRNSFLNLDLNVWTESRTVWVSPEAWEACRREGESDPPDLADLVACVGIDLSETTDLTAIVAAFRRPDTRDADEIEVEGGSNRTERRTVAVDFSVDLKAWFFLPRDKLRERVHKDRVPYDVWAREGWLTVTDGSIIDYRAVRNTLLDIRDAYTVREWGFDPYNATQLCTVLEEEDGLPMVSVRQGYLSLSPPAKLLEGLIAAQRIRHDGNPIMRWCFANTEVATDPAGNIKPVKPGGEARGTRRIDGVVATVIALSRLMVASTERESPGITMIRF